MFTWPKFISLNVAQVRLELLGLTSGQLPCFGGLGISLLERPKIDFSLKVANMVDVMGIPTLTSFFQSAQPGVKVQDRIEAKAVLGHWIEMVVANVMLYPKKYIIPLSMQKRASYLLAVKVISCKDLVAADLNGKMLSITPE
jgi:hypothetical protein